MRLLICRPLVHPGKALLRRDAIGAADQASRLRFELMHGDDQLAAALMEVTWTRLRLVEEQRGAVDDCDTREGQRDAEGVPAPLEGEFPPRTCDHRQNRHTASPRQFDRPRLDMLEWAAGPIDVDHREVAIAQGLHQLEGGECATA